MDNLEYALRQHAYVIGQCVCLQARIAGMQAENLVAEGRGETPPYGEDAFEKVTNEYSVDHNSVLGLFQY